MLLPQLRRIRWAVRATLLLGVAASVLANILHALDNPISQAIAAWPPVALLLTVELISRVPVGRRLLAATRLIATAIIAGIAAWVSYWHMAGVAARYGETGASPYLLPLSVDGLIVVASICLVELGGRIATMEQPATPTTAPAPGFATQAGSVAPQTGGLAPQAGVHTPQGGVMASQGAAAGQWSGVDPELQPAGAWVAQSADAFAGPQPGQVSHIMVDALPEEPARSQTPDPGLIRAAAARTGANPVVTARDDSTQAGSTQAGSAQVGSAQGASDGSSASTSHVEMPSPLRRSTAAALAEAASALPRSTGFNPAVTRGSGDTQRLGRNAGSPTSGRATANAGAGNRPAPGQRRPDSSGKNGPSSRSRRSPAETVALAARIHADRPNITEAELAAELGISLSRWRTVRREAAPATDSELAA